MYIKGSKRINIDAVFKIVVFLGFAFLFYTMIASGEINYYVHPRIVPYVKWGIGALVLIALFTTRDLFRLKRHVNMMPYLFFLIPLVTGFVLPVKVMDATSTATGVQLTRKVPTYDSAQPSIKPAIEFELDSDKTFKTVAENTATNLPMEEQVPGIPNQIDDLLDGKTFLKTVNNLSSDLDGSVGQEVELAGFIYEEEDFEPNQFVIGRYVITCCAADAEIYGILCKDMSVFDHKVNSWVKIKGTVEKTAYMSSYDNKEIEMAQIVIDEIESIVSPEDPYIYYSTK